MDARGRSKWRPANIRIRLQKLWRLLGVFIFARKVWSWPKQSDVLIFDACEAYVFHECLQTWNPTLLHLRGEQVNVRVLLASLFKSGRRSDAYIDCFIKKVCPRLIVTYIDNNVLFFSLASKHKSAKTLFVQNGVRGSELFEELGRRMSYGDSFKVDYMMTFGSRIGREYARYVQGAVVPMGSIKNNFVCKRHAKRAGTIAFVSQYRHTNGIVCGGKSYTRQEFFERADRLVLGFLSKYANSHGKKLFIIPCSGLHGENGLQDEINYYNELIGQNCSYSNMTAYYAGYDAVDSAEVVVSIDSTLGYESVARGNKTAIVSIRFALLGMADRAYGWPETYPNEGPFWTNSPNAVVFERILDHLFAVNDEEWHADLAEHGFASLMAYDPGNSVLKSVLKKVLGEPDLDLALAEKLHNPPHAMPLVASNQKN